MIDRRLVPALMVVWWLVVAAAGVQLNRVHGQTATSPLQMCLPGFYGKQWPGSDFAGPTRTVNGWYAFVLCDGGGGRLFYRLRVCVHGECIGQAQVGSNVGSLIIAANTSGNPDRSVAFESSNDAKVVYYCPPVAAPSGGVPLYVVAPGASVPTPALPVAQPGTPRGAICADVSNAILAAWPMTPAPPSGCMPQSLQWIDSVANGPICAAQYPGGAHGNVMRLLDATGPDTGSANATCNNGSLTLTEPACVTAAAPPPNPSAGWVAYGGTIFKLGAAGKLASVVSGKTATKGAACVGVTITTAGTLVYQQLVGGPTDEATRCVKP